MAWQVTVKCSVESSQKKGSYTKKQVFKRTTQPKVSEIQAVADQAKQEYKQMENLRGRVKTDTTVAELS